MAFIPCIPCKSSVNLVAANVVLSFVPERPVTFDNNVVFGWFY